MYNIQAEIGPFLVILPADCMTNNQTTFTPHLPFADSLSYAFWKQTVSFLKTGTMHHPRIGLIQTPDLQVCVNPSGEDTSLHVNTVSSRPVGPLISTTSNSLRLSEK